MFLAELAYNTVQNEIKELDNKKTRREKALNTSTKELENDHIDLIQFITDDNNMKAQRDELDKQYQMERNKKDESLKKLDNEI